MGISIDVHIYDTEKFLRALKDKGASEPMLTKILSEFGTFTRDSYILLNNELYDENPYYSCIEIIDKYFNIDSHWDCFLNREIFTEGINFADKYDVLERLGLPKDLLKEDE